MEKYLKKIKKFSIWDFICYEVALVSIGILLGTYFSVFFKEKIIIIWIITLITYLYIIFKVFNKKKDD